MTDFQHLLVSHREAAPPAPGVAPARVATLTLHRPQRKNSLSPVLVNELLHGLDAALGDPSVRVVVLEGGGGTFCAGADLGGGDGDSALPVKGDFSDLLLALSRAEKPVVAKVRGVAMGGGVGLAAACHFAVTTDDAVWSTPGGAPGAVAHDDHGRARAHRLAAAPAGADAARRQALRRARCGDGTRQPRGARG
jgi:enoyl-CoA hydratase/carnithine racemase